MNTIPADLTLRLESIYSQKEINSLQSVFALAKKPVTFRINTLSATSQEVEEGLNSASIKFKKLDFPSGSYLIDEEFSESDIWKRRIYKD